MGTGVSSEALFDAVCAKDVRKASVALEKGVDVNAVAKVMTRYGGVYGFPSALHVACANSSIDLVDLLLQHQVNISYHEERDGSTPLHLSCSSYYYYDNHLPIVKLLISSGADVSAVNKRGQTPLQAAEQQLQKDWGDPTKENRSQIISYLKELNENSSVAAGNSASNIADSTTAVADNDHPSC